jgi:hypothetical protein
MRRLQIMLICRKGRWLSDPFLGAKLDVIKFNSHIDKSQWPSR